MNLNDYESSYDALLKKVNSTTLHLNRLRLIVSETFKVIHNQSPKYLKSLVKVKFSNYNFRNLNILKTQHVRTTRYGKNPFVLKLSGCVNSLPEDIRTVDKYKDFVRLTQPGRIQNANAPCVTNLLLTLLLVFVVLLI